MNDQPSPEVMAQAKAAGLRRGDSFSYSNDPKAAAAYHRGDGAVGSPRDFRTLIREARSGNAIADQDLLDSLADAIEIEGYRADLVQERLNWVRRYAEDRSLHYRAKKDSVVSSWRIAEDLFAILNREVGA